MERQIPDNHDCDKNGCFNYFDDERSYHTDDYGLCLGCGGCGDPEHCGGHDESCSFESLASRTARRNSNTVEESPDT